jgi:hypothetical protein
MTLTPGQHVVCIDDRRKDGPEFGLVRGRVYTVRALHMEPEWDHYGVALDEINPVVGDTIWLFKADRFRPVNPNALGVLRRALVPA